MEFHELLNQIHELENQQVYIAIQIYTKISSLLTHFHIAYCLHIYKCCELILCLTHKCTIESDNFVG
jgi:hypothetical protein